MKQGYQKPARETERIQILTIIQVKLVEFRAVLRKEISNSEALLRAKQEKEDKERLAVELKATLTLERKQLKTLEALTKQQIPRLPALILVPLWLKL